MDALRTFPRFSLFFLALMILEILGLTVIPTYHIVSKPMILAGLIGFYIFEEKKQNNIFILGLIFALLGDCFMLFEHDDLFLVGLICFLIMQICYAYTFNHKKRIARDRAYIVPACIALVGIGILTFLWSDLGSMRIAVLVYSFAIVSMAILAYLRHPLVRGYGNLLLGVGLFIVSDALLAIDKFGNQISHADIYIMITYMLAQYFIVTGEVLGNMKKPELIIKSTSAFGRHKIAD